ncbi:MAG: hypothetical protein QOE28_1530 [Solirubrobacteraceae bacterium]|nr:hypothetical protein [Solirubrobacteraceae bacterium]
MHILTIVRRLGASIAITGALAAVASPQALAASPSPNAYGPGCDPALPVVAHHAGGAPAATADKAVACAVETGKPTSESTIAVGNDGTVLYSPAQTENSLARSSDEGASWSLTQPADAQQTALWNTVDPQITVDPRTGRAFWIHATGQLRTAPILVSGSPLPWELTTAFAYASGFQVYGSDDAQHWRTADYSSEPMGDWEKVAVGPPAAGAPQPHGYPDVVYACANSPFEVSGPGRLCYRSLDGGATFERAGYVFPSASSPVASCPALATNTEVVGPDGALYQPVSCDKGAFVAVSHDEGVTYSWERVPNAPASDGLSGALQLSMDGAGDLFASWLAGDTISLAVSRDGAKTWSAPRVISGPGLHAILFAAPAAGNRGQFGVAYYASTDAKAASLTAYVSEVPDALAANPVIYTAALNDPAHPIFHDYAFDATPRADFVGAAFDRGGTLWAGMVKQLAAPDADNRVATTGYVGRLLLVGAGGAAGPGGATLRASCAASRRLVFLLGRVPGGRVVRAVAYINGRRVAVRRGHSLRRLAFDRPRGRRLVVRIVTTNNKGGRVITVRTYRGCTRTPLKTRHVRHRRT